MMELSSLSPVDFVIFLVVFQSSCAMVKLIRGLLNSINRLIVADSKDYTSARIDEIDGEDYPNCWIPAAEKEQLKTGTVLNIIAVGREVVLIRDSKGKVHAIDPHCPLNGPHLGSGEIVQINGEDCIRCTFHQCSFRLEDGVCIDNPYLENGEAIEGSVVKTWHCMEIRDLIFIWHHIKGEGPTYIPEPIYDIESGKEKFHGRGEIRLKCDIYTIGENTADFAHFGIIHRYAIRTGILGKLLGLNSYLIEHIYTNTSWTPGEHRKAHEAILSSQNYFKVHGIPDIQVEVKAVLCGPTTDLIQLKFSWLCFTFRRQFTFSIFPIRNNEIRLVTRYYGPDNFFSRIISLLLLKGTQLELVDDSEIWKNKIRLRNPSILKEEKPMAVFRRWYSQFQCSLE